MIQYGYANFEHKGYMIASGNGFFREADTRRKQKLARLVRHYAGTAENKISYMGITTDLGLESENPKFYFQMSGQEVVRSADFAHGFAADIDGNGQDIFGENFPKLLRARFMDSQRLCGIRVSKCEGEFPDIDFPEEDNITPAVLSPDILAEILAGLMRQRRVILRLNCRGNEAARFARMVLLRVYECLPYGVRKSAGFCTNVSRARFEAGVDRLPQSVRLCLIDEDTDFPSGEDGCTVLDMKRPPNKGADYQEAEVFLNFLISGSEKDRKSYFKKVFSLAEKETDGMTITLKMYQDYYRYLFYMQEREITDDDISDWYEWYWRNRSGAQGMNQVFLSVFFGKKQLSGMESFLKNKEFLEKLLPPQAREIDFGDLRRYTGELDKLFLLFESACFNNSNDPSREIGRMGTVFSEYLREWTGFDNIVDKNVSAMTEKGPEAVNLNDLTRMAERIKKESDDRSILGVAWNDLYRELSRFLKRVEDGRAARALEEAEKMGKMLAESATRQITFRALADICRTGMKTDVFPICGKRMKESENFREAFGADNAERLQQLFDGRDRARAIAELNEYIRDWEDARDGGLQTYVTISADGKAYVDAVQWYISQRRDTLGENLTLLKNLKSPDCPAAALGRAVYEEAVALAGRELSDRKYEREEILKNLLLCRELAETEKSCIRSLTEPLWDVDLSNGLYLRMLLGRREEWLALSAICQKEVEFYWENRFLIHLTAEEAIPFMESLLQRQEPLSFSDIEKAVKEKMGVDEFELNADRIKKDLDRISKEINDLDKREKNRSEICLPLFGLLLLVSDLTVILWGILSAF